VKVKDDEQKQWALTLLAVSSLFQLVSADKLIRGVAWRLLQLLIWQSVHFFF
jgi:hypothetical protein